LIKSTKMSVIIGCWRSKRGMNDWEEVK
jgi:hypothetical protein